MTNRSGWWWWGLTLLALALPGVACSQSDDAGVDAALEKVEALQAELETLQAEGAKRADDPEYFFRLGNVYAELSRREDAIAAYEAALDLKPEYVEVLVNLGATLNDRGEPERALPLLQKAVELRPEDAKGHVNLGNTYYGQGQFPEAIAEFLKALEVDEKAYEANYQLGVAYADAGIYREAIREWKRVVALAPETDAAKSAQTNIEVVERILARHP